MNTKVGFLAATALFLASNHAFAAPTFGSASESTYRDCTGAAATEVCDGTGPGQNIKATALSGGALSTANSDLTLSGQTIPKPFGAPGTVTLPNTGSYARSTVDFDAALDLPVIHGSTSAIGNERMNINSIGYQSYDFSGPTGAAFSLTGALEIDDASFGDVSGVLPGGARYTAYVAIWDPSVLGTFVTAADLFNNTFLADCSVSGVLAVGQMVGTLNGGAQSISVTTSSCSPGPLTLTHGQEVLAVAGLQLPVNRGGFADATHTYTTTLGNDLTADAKSVLVAGLHSGSSVLAVPEPTTWAMLLMGFLGLGAALRRRRAVLAV